MRTVEQALAAYGESDYTVKVCRGIFGVVPGAPPFVLYPDLAGAVGRARPGAGGDVLDGTRALAASDPVLKAMRAADAMDAADTGLAVVSGVRNVLALFGGRSAQRRTFESDPQQCADAGAKLLGLSYIIWNLFEGDLKQKVAAFTALPAGQEAGIYYAVAEAGLPFVDNLAEGAGSVFGRLAGEAGRAAPRFASLGGAGVEGAAGLLGELSGALGGLLEGSRQHLGSVVGGVRGYLPSMLGATDSVTGAVATGLDVLPIWGFLGARLAAEACAARASGGA